MSDVRNIIVHYHLFKNAGSSVDQLLKRNLGDKWMTYDGDTSNAIIACQQLEELIVNNPEVKALSSHQIIPPVPQLDMNIYPIVFLRDPIDRIKSAYLFEWKKQLGLDNAKGTLEEYVKEKFTYRRQNSIEEFQTVRLSNQFRDRYHDINSFEDDELLENASKFIQSLRFVGIVDEFDRSQELLLNFIKPGFPDFKASDVKANVLQDLKLTRAQKRTAIREELGAEVYEMILERNKLDESLYQFGKAHFDKLCSATANKAA